MAPPFAPALGAASWAIRDPSKPQKSLSNQRPPGAVAATALSGRAGASAEGNSESGEQERRKAKGLFPGFLASCFFLSSPPRTERTFGSCSVSVTETRRVPRQTQTLWLMTDAALGARFSESAVPLRLKLAASRSSWRRQTMRCRAPERKQRHFPNTSGKCPRCPCATGCSRTSRAR